MRLAETVRSRWVIALASVAVAGTAIALSMTCGDAPAKKSSPVKAWSGCKQRKASPPVKHEPKGADYRDVLLSVKPAFDACTRDEPIGLRYGIRAPIGPDGHVMSIEVRGESDDLAKVDMRVIKCVERVMMPLQFPATGETSFVSTVLVTQ